MTLKRRNTYTSFSKIGKGGDDEYEHRYDQRELEGGLCEIICPILPVGISGHIFVDTLHPNLQPCAAIGQHVT